MTRTDTMEIVRKAVASALAAEKAKAQRERVAKSAPGVRDSTLEERLTSTHVLQDQIRKGQFVAFRDGKPVAIATKAVVQAAASVKSGPAGSTAAAIERVFEGTGSPISSTTKTSKAFPADVAEAAAAMTTMPHGVVPTCDDIERAGGRNCRDADAIAAFMRAQRSLNDKR
jgi:hypothetical protein